MIKISDDFAAIYYGTVPRSLVFSHRDIYYGFSEFLKSRGIGTYILNEEDKKNGKILKKSYVSSPSNPDQFHWRIGVNIISVESGKLITIGLVPEARQPGFVPNKIHINGLATFDLRHFKEKIGKSISILIGEKEVSLTTFSFGECNVIDIGNWVVNLSQDKSISYSNYANSKSSVLQEMKKVALTFRLINLSTRDQSKKGEIIRNEFSKLGNVIEPVLDRYYATKLSIVEQKKDIMNVILTESDQDYHDSKQFFLSKGLPFQHLRDINKFSNNTYSRDVLLLEIIKKMNDQALYLKPDFMETDFVSGFIYLDDISKKIVDTGKYSRFLNISYVFTDSKDWTSERIFVYSPEEIPFYSRRGFLEFTDANKLANRISEDSEIKRGDNHHFDIILTKDITIKNAHHIVNGLKERDIMVNRIYYVSNYLSRFADNFNAISPTESFTHPFKILVDNIAVVKLATKPYLLPQMFSTLVKIIYPQKVMIQGEDISKIIWLTKKRLYRIYNLSNMTLMEPVVIRRNNKEFLTQGLSSVYLLRHLI